MSLPPRFLGSGRSFMHHTVIDRITRTRAGFGLRALCRMLPEKPLSGRWEPGNFEREVSSGCPPHLLARSAKAGCVVCFASLCWRQRDSLNSTASDLDFGRTGALYVVA